MYRLVSLLALAALAACSRGAPPVPEPGASSPAAVEAPALPPVMGPERRILAVGDSLFAGYGLASPAESYPARLEAALRARGINARIANAGVSGDTSGAGAERFAFVLKSQPRKPDLILLEFGGNDVLRALPPEQTRANLDRMLAEARAQGVPVVLMGLLAPPNLGPDYKARFEPIYPALAKQYGARLVPFFLAPVIGKPDLIQDDHIHPNARGVDEIVAASVEQVAGALPRS
ncbi:arylesterase [Novosphingobium piscinae]|uniref:Arylesterase n=1 Tax=Novosphingobium piscinae TaxID=1507448 RepID=A0A7X1KNT1_9SPHN|nr:arylesterase [Novosphingobium piscinae]MBC2667962.1 arylesterase [Novosphingobium piscinae]